MKKKVYKKPRKRITPLSRSLRPLTKTFDLEQFNNVIVTVDDMTFEIDWASATKNWEDDYDLEGIATTAVLAEVQILRAKTNRDLKDLERRRAKAYAKAFSDCKRGGDGSRRITDKEAEADAKGSPRVVAIQEDIDDTEYAIDVLDALVVTLRIKSELVRTLIIKQPAI